MNREEFEQLPVHIGDPAYEEAMSAEPTKTEEYCRIAAYTPEGE